MAFEEPNCTISTPIFEITVIAVADLPNTSDTAESSATLQMVKAFWKRFFSLLFMEVSL